jgi:hypothetical protein
MSTEAEENKVSALLDALEHQQHDPANDPAKSFDFLFEWMVNRITLLGFEYTSKGPNDPNTQAITTFLTDAQLRTFVIIKQGDELLFQSLPLGQGNMTQAGLCAYFLRQNLTGKEVPLTQNNVEKEVQYGTIGGKGLSIAAFERVMKGLVEKQVEKNNELAGNPHTYDK